MTPFSFTTPPDSSHALSAAGQPGAAFIAGGTTLLDLMKLNVEQPTHLVDIHRLPLNKIESTAGGGLSIGATVTNSDLAYHPLVLERYPALSQALLSGASPQLRNMATTAGNLLQRTRCPYFRDTSYPCNKRNPGSGCAALDGFNRSHALLGTSEKCIATHPSDMCIPLAAFDAVIVVQVGSRATRRIPFDAFYIPYGEDPAKENTLAPGELILGVELPPIRYADKSLYLKVRDRASYEFALASAAVALDVEGGVIREARIALGGIASKPWRAKEAESFLQGKAPTPENFAAAAAAALAGAKPRQHNAFKIPLAKKTLIAALAQATSPKH